MMPASQQERVMISYKEMMAAADAAVPRLKPDEAKAMIAAGIEVEK